MEKVLKMKWFQKYTMLCVLVLSLLVSFALYSNTLHGDFVYDDLFFVRRAELRDPGALLRVWLESYLPNNQTAVAYRPLPMFTFSLNYVFFGESSVSFHAVNIFLNGITIFLLFLVIWKIFHRRIVAIFTAFFYAFLPIHTEAVAFIKARDDILATLFGLLAWVVFLKATEKEKLNPWLVLLSSLVWVLAILGKEIAIVMPALFLLVFWIREQASLRLMITVASLFIPATLGYFALRFMILGEQFLTRDFVYFLFDPIRYADLTTRLWTAFKILFIYVSKTFVPIHLSATYTYNHLKLVSNPFDSPETITGVLLLGGLLFLVIHKRTRKTLGIGALMFLVPYLMLSKFFVQLSEIASEKWMYLPSIGLSLIAGFIFYSLFRYKKWLGIVAFVIVLALYTPILIKRNFVWASQEALFTSMAKDAPDSAFARYSLAQMYYEQHKFDEAKAELAEALKIYQDYAPFMNLVGMLALKEGRNDIADRAFQRSIELKPNEAAALLLTQRGRYQESLDLIRTMDPRLKKRSDVTFLLALNYYKLGMLEEAKKYFHWDPSKSEEEKMRILEDF